MENLEILICIILLFVGIMCFYFTYLWWKEKRNAAKEEKNKIADKYNAVLTGLMKHTSGLSLPQGVWVNVYYCPDKIVFKKDGQEFILSRNKIIDLDLVTGKDIRAQQMAGAATGKFVLGGNIGAVIGTLAATTIYLAVTYESNGKDKCILLDTAMSGSLSIKMKKDFDKTSTEKNKSIEL